ncbi:DUF6083 domain-containing protein [Streptomyces sp. SID13726]|uniref:DUF6083 domain-containing protein n=1 Tax=Streptomyces sp. SID13726 TaxID=2706058 RepID=UPI0013BACBE7|nr:DUF6083 domain-containing protein [Streptomyces sp. SID13726]NEB04230.1 hypothetical protein [Streptomyces sp. SID13726]
MRPHPTPAARHRHGSPRTAPLCRPLRMAATSPSRLLRTGHSGRCRWCGNRINWHQRADQRPIELHPTELTAADVPASCRWHLSSGIAHPHGDGSAWCRVPHSVLCPRHTPTAPTSPHIEAVRRQLAVHTRRLIDNGVFTPAPAVCEPAPGATGRPARPVVQLLLGRYLAETAIEDIQCVAQTRQRRRCPQPVLAPHAPQGRWTLLPTYPQSDQLALPAGWLAVYDLNRLPCTEQLRWRTQRCPSHAATWSAAGLAQDGWQVFDPLLHAEHIHTRLPHPAPCHRRKA